MTAGAIAVGSVEFVVATRRTQSLSGLDVKLSPTRRIDLCIAVSSALFGVD